MPEQLKSAFPSTQVPEDAKAQLERIFHSQPFRNSRRCQSLLSYVVEKACEGRIDELKERTVGSLVFGREADYDTNQDAVVRNAAAEVRKRLAQYYMEPGHEAELRIDLPAGSYVPEFRPPAPHPPDTPTAPKPRPVARWSAVVAVIAALALAAALLMRFQPQIGKPATELDQFWSPVIAAQGAAQVCIGQSRHSYYDGTPPSDARAVDASRFKPMQDRFVWFGDAVCMSRVSGYLTTQGKQHRFRGARTTPYAELRGYPVVLIGAFNNEWTMRLTQGLRFSLARTDQTFSVQDIQKSGGPQWMVQRPGPSVDTEEDYALVTRLFDPDTERWVIAAGGITHYGTMMTGDFLTNPDYFREAVRSAPRDWSHKNMQVVLQTKIVGGTPGPPRVLATHFW